jgi:hypothetical protein
MKIIFVPFESTKAGNLINMVSWEPGKQKPGGKQKGFKSGDRLFAPKQVDKGYAPAGGLNGLAKKDDQLYINGHCAKGLHYLASEEKCDSTTAQQVDIPTLLAQLEARGFPKNSEAKVKLFACEGAVDDGERTSFAKEFSKAVYEKGWKFCRVFAYDAKLVSDYRRIGNDTEFHKVVTISPEKYVREMVSKIEQGQRIRINTSDITKMVTKQWNLVKAASGGDPNAAVKRILCDESFRKVFLGVKDAYLGTRIGVQAKLCRTEFKNGNRINTGSEEG